MKSILSTKKLSTIQKDQLLQIGRASGRERVEISVVAGAVNKKYIITQYRIINKT